MAPNMPSELVSWATVQRLTAELARRIRVSEYAPQVIVAIGRGGYVPARLLCDYLDIAELSAIRVSHYRAGARQRRVAQLVEPLCYMLDGREVLLVDDVSDSGDTLLLARDHLLRCGAGEVRIAVLHHKQGSQVEPEFYGRRVVRWRWVIYPWAVHEDIGAFLQRLPRLPRDTDEAAALLWQAHGIRLKPRLLQELCARLMDSSDC